MPPASAARPWSCAATPETCPSPIAPSIKTIRPTRIEAAPYELGDNATNVSSSVARGYIRGDDWNQRHSVFAIKKDSAHVLNDKICMPDLQLKERAAARLDDVLRQGKKDEARNEARTTESGEPGGKIVAGTGEWAARPSTGLRLVAGRIGQHAGSTRVLRVETRQPHRPRATGKRRSHPARGAGEGHPQPQPADP